MKKMINKSRWVYVISFFLSIFLVFLVYKLWKFDFGVPLGYYNDGDHKSTLMTLKRASGIKNFFETDCLGAPFSASNYDYPMFGDLLNIIYFRIFIVLFGDLAKGVNFGFFFLFPLTTLTSLAVMKELKIKNLYAVMGSILFSFLPYRFIRSTSHLFLSCYWQIPLVIILILWLLNDEKFWKFNGNFFREKKNYLGIIFCAIIAYTGVYYAFFGVLLIIVSMIYDAFNSRSLKKIYKYIFGSAIIASFLIVADIPYIFFKMSKGPNLESPVRAPWEAENYGMKIVQLLMPLRNYGISFIQKLQEQYANAPLPNEGSEYIGLIGIIGFFVLVIYLLCNRVSKNSNLILISRLNLFAVLIGTIGGAGSLFALLISAQIRGYNRISVYIAFFSISAVGIVLSNMDKKWSKYLFIPIMGVYIISLLDQTSIAPTNYESDINSFESDREIVQTIEKSVPEGSMIYNWVYQPYPENPPINDMGDYASARGYIHSSTLKWSYGDQKGRESDLWNRELSEYEIGDRIQIIKEKGFVGIWVDTNAYLQDEVDQVINEITNYTKTGAIVSKDGRIIYIPL